MQIIMNSGRRSNPIQLVKEIASLPSVARNDEKMPRFTLSLAYLYSLNKLKAETVIALTPVLRVGSGSGANRLE